MSKLVGVVKVVGTTLQVSDKFAKRDIVITDFGKYPQDVLFQLTQDRCSLADNIKIGEEVEISYNIRGKEWVNPTTGEVKYFNTLEAWRIEITSIRDRGNHQAEQAPQHPTTPQQPTVDGADDLPF